MPGMPPSYSETSAGDGGWHTGQGKAFRGLVAGRGSKFGHSGTSGDLKVREEESNNIYNQISPTPPYVLKEERKGVFCNPYNFQNVSSGPGHSSNSSILNVLGVNRYTIQKSHIENTPNSLPNQSPNSTKSHYVGDDEDENEKVTVECWTWQEGGVETIITDGVFIIYRITM
jgi:hypothetical protein